MGFAGISWLCVYFSSLIQANNCTQFKCRYQSMVFLFCEFSLGHFGFAPGRWIGWESAPQWPDVPLLRWFVCVFGSSFGSAECSSMLFVCVLADPVCVSPALSSPAGWWFTNGGWQHCERTESDRTPEATRRGQKTVGSWTSWKKLEKHGKPWENKDEEWWRCEVGN